MSQKIELRRIRKLLQKTLEVQEKLLRVLDSHHQDARAAWEIEQKS